MRNTRQAILDAALQVVEQNGANHLTIDAVAAKSGFSKGGVLYHFASKRALLSGMLDYLIESNTARMNAQANSSNRLAALLSVEPQMTAAEKRAFLALVAAAAEDSELLAPAREYIHELLGQIEQESPSRMDSLLLFFAGEGLRFFEIFELNPLTPEETRRFSRHLAGKAEKLK